MSKVPGLAPDFDIGAAYPVVKELRTALAAGNWLAAKATYESVGWDGKSILAEAVRDERAEPMLRKAIEHDPNDSIAATLLANRLILAAWDVRTRAGAVDISEDQFAQFEDMLNDAERLLHEAAAREPGNVITWELRLLTSLGLELGIVESRRRYASCAAVEPHHLPAQANLLLQLAPRWGGSFDEMHGFARKCMLAAPDGALNAVTVPLAHIESWAEHGSAGDRYIQRKRVRSEIAEAAERSVLHPEFRRTYGWVFAQNTFAMAFILMDDYHAAAAHFDAVGHLASEHPWRYLVDPAAGFAYHQAIAASVGQA